MFNKITRNKIATTRNISNNKKATNNKIKTTRNKIKSNWLWLDASPTLVDKANGVSRWSLNLVRISQWSQLHLHIAVVAVVLSILLRHCCRHLKFVEVLDSVDATSDLWLAPQSIADNKGSSRSCRQDPVLGESPDNHDVVRVMMTMMMAKSKYWSPPRAQHYQRSACQKADLVRTTYECSTRSPPWLCTHSRWKDSANLKSFDNCNVLFFFSQRLDLAVGRWMKMEPVRGSFLSCTCFGSRSRRPSPQRWLPMPRSDLKWSHQVLQDSDKWSWKWQCCGHKPFAWWWAGRWGRDIRGQGGNPLEPGFEKPAEKVDAGV